MISHSSRPSGSIFSSMAAPCLLVCSVLFAFFLVVVVVGCSCGRTLGEHRRFGLRQAGRPCPGHFSAIRAWAPLPDGHVQAGADAPAALANDRHGKRADAAASTRRAAASRFISFSSVSPAFLSSFCCIGCCHCNLRFGDEVKTHVRSFENARGQSLQGHCHGFPSLCLKGRRGKGWVSPFPPDAALPVLPRRMSLPPVSQLSPGPTPCPYP